jgi:hypothetical protein
MARKPTGNPVGCPPKDIDFTRFEEMCSDWCTIPEIAARLKISDDTLRRRVEEQYGEDFAVIYKRHFNNGTPSFRRERRVLSRKNAAMSIWLGKVHLGEKDFETSNLTNITINSIDYSKAIDAK